MSNFTRAQRRVVTLFLVLLIAGAGRLYGADFRALKSAEADSGYRGISSRYYLKQVKYLAGKDLKGRGNGSPELDRAAEYIAREFQQAGLAPAGDDGGFFQKFSIIASTQLGSGNRLQITVGSKSPLEFKLHENYALRSFSGQSDQTQIAGPIVFAGYGITADEYQYDDYKGLDVADKIVLILDDEPQEKDPNSKFNGTQLTYHATLASKAVNAKNHGAKAVLLVRDVNNHPEDKEDNFSSGRWPTEDLGIVTVKVKSSMIDSVLSLYKTSLSDLQKEIDANLAPKSFPLHGVQAAIAIDAQHVRKQIRNVVGAIHGNGSAPAEDFIVLGAHYDHLGLGGRTSLAPESIGKIHYGADDNASGTAGLLTLAHALAKDRNRLRRGVVFVAFAGEEVGLLGSSYYTKNPKFPLEKTVAMINMDMIGRPRERKIKVGGVGTAAEWPELVRWASGEVGLTPEPSQSGYGSSDHASFNMKNIPVLFLFSGLHSDYHKPTDVWRKIDAPGAEKVVRMAYLLTRALDHADPRPQYVKVREDLPSPVGSSGSGSGGYGPYFGSIPDMAEEVQGVRFADVRENSPAAKAGFKGGDTLVQFDGKKITNLQEFTYALRGRKVGDEVEVVVLRDGNPVRARVKLEARK